MRNTCVGVGVDKNFGPITDLIWQYGVKTNFFREIFNIDADSKNRDMSKGSVVRKMKDVMGCYLLADGELFCRIGEPRYLVKPTLWPDRSPWLEVSYWYNPYISKKMYFSVLQGNKAVAEATRIALSWGDARAVERIRQIANQIVVHMPEMVRLNTDEHGASGG